jgi:hypothetical protein
MLWKKVVFMQGEFWVFTSSYGQNKERDTLPKHQLTVQINQQTRYNNLSSLLLDVYLQLNMFRASSRPLTGAQQLQ